ncbi:MAG: hypothetical protein JSR44_14970 [Spirochaetes bacterium]|nr:hypothetical protein [Spirochaetota bacterium]
MKNLATIIVTTVMLFAACGKKTDANAKGPAGACHREKEFYCNEYYGMATKKWVENDNCKPMNVPYLAKCPTQGAIKRCVFDGGTMQERHLLIYSAKADFYCKQPGVVEKVP